MVGVDAWVGMGVVVVGESPPPIARWCGDGCPLPPKIPPWGSPLGCTACKVCGPIFFQGSPPWRQFVRSMGGRGQLPARGRPTSGRKHMASPRVCGVNGRWGPNPHECSSPICFPPPLCL